MKDKGKVILLKVIFFTIWEIVLASKLKILVQLLTLKFYLLIFTVLA